MSETALRLSDFSADETRPPSLRGYDVKAASVAFSTAAGGPSPVQQQFGEEVDINTIVRRFGMTRAMPSGIAGGVYGDFTGIEDFASAVAAVERARDGFMALAPDVRERFGNDPGRLIEFVHSATEEQLRAFDPPVVAPVAPVVPPAAPAV